MILQALVELYDHLEENEPNMEEGWQIAKVSYALQIDDAGNLVHVVSTIQRAARGKKEFFVPGEMSVPFQPRRSSGIDDYLYFLCDRPGYILGINREESPERTKKCFELCKRYHEKLLSNCDHPAARAIRKFFTQWKPEDADKCAALDEYREEISSGSVFLVFRYKGEYAQDIPALRDIWNAVYFSDTDAPVMRCLVTGKRGPIAKVHPAIKGICGGQGSGTSLVSFNNPASKSHGHDKEQGENAPVSKHAAFAYVTALNWLLRQNDYHLILGKEKEATTIVFWSENAEPAFSRLFNLSLNGGSGKNISQVDLTIAMKKLASGQAVDWEGISVHPENRFYILGFAPNSGRSSVRFFLCDSFGTFIKRMQEHFERLEIAQPSRGGRKMLPLWLLLKETVNPKSKDESPLPKLQGETLRAILLGLPYPETLYSHVQLRLRAGDGVVRSSRDKATEENGKKRKGKKNSDSDQQRANRHVGDSVSPGKAAIIKAYLIKNTEGRAKYSEYKEVLQVALNEKNTYVPYLLGRLFAVLEYVQLASTDGKINTTIADSYFSSASATPALIFPIIMKLHRSHLRKLDANDQKTYSDLVMQIYNGIGDNLPNRLDLQDQGVFQIGYYHQALKLDNQNQKEAN